MSNKIIVLIISVCDEYDLVVRSAVLTDCRLCVSNSKKLLGKNTNL